MPTEPEPLPADLAAAHAMTLVSAARLEIERLRLLLAKARRERFGASSERGSRLIDRLELQLAELQLAELQLAELEETAAEDEAMAGLAQGAAGTTLHEHARQRPARRPLPAHLPRQRVVIPPPSRCPCCGGNRLA